MPTSPVQAQQLPDSPTGCAIDAPFALQNARTPTLHETYFGRCAVRITKYWQQPGSPALPRFRLTLGPKVQLTKEAKEELRNLQIALWYAGWNVEETGQWDKATQTAIMELQKAFGISPIDGAFNARTRFVLNCLIEGTDPFRKAKSKPPVIEVLPAAAPDVSAPDKSVAVAQFPTPAGPRPAPAPPAPAPSGPAAQQSGGFIDFLDNIRDFLAEQMPNLFRRKLPQDIPVEIQLPPLPPPRPQYLACAVLKEGVQWLDLQDKPLYKPPQGKTGAGYLMNEAVLEQTLTTTMLNLLHQVAPYTANLGGPDRGRYAGMTYPQILEKLSGEELTEFLAFVYTYPRKYVGKPLKFANAYVAWLRAGAVTV